MSLSVKVSSSYPFIGQYTDQSCPLRVSLSDLGKAVMYRGEEDRTQGRGERGDSDHIVKHQGATLASSQGEQAKH